MYKLSGVTKNYHQGRGTVAALRGVDLVIEDDEWLAVQGPTGHCPAWRTWRPRWCRCASVRSCWPTSPPGTWTRTPGTRSSPPDLAVAGPGTADPGAGLPDPDDSEPG